MNDGPFNHSDVIQIYYCLVKLKIIINHYLNNISYYYLKFQLLPTLSHITRTAGITLIVHESFAILTDFIYGLPKPINQKHFIPNVSLVVKLSELHLTNKKFTPNIVYTSFCASVCIADAAVRLNQFGLLVYRHIVPDWYIQNQSMHSHGNIWTNNKLTQTNSNSHQSARSSLGSVWVGETRTIQKYN